MDCEKLDGYLIKFLNTSLPLCLKETRLCGKRRKINDGRRDERYLKYEVK